MKTISEQIHLAESLLTHERLSCLPVKVKRHRIECMEGIVETLKMLQSAKEYMTVIQTERE